MAELSEVEMPAFEPAAGSVQVKCGRKRKANFSVAEVAVITENVEKYKSILQSKFTTNVTNKKKNMLWEEITIAVNALGVEVRTVQDVKDKWKNLHSVAKKEYSVFRRESVKTGGGPAPKKPSLASEKIIELYEDTPGFSGLEGFESGGPEELIEAHLPEEAEVACNASVLYLTTEEDAISLLSEVQPQQQSNIQNIKQSGKRQGPATKISKKKISSDDVLRVQYEALVCKKENLLLKKRKLELQIQILERQVSE